jgi:hypothetical protein
MWLLLVTSCASQEQRLEGQRGAEVVAEGDLNDVAWTQAGIVVSETVGIGERISLVDAEDGTETPLRPKPPPNECDATEFSQPGPVAGSPGLLSSVMVCFAPGDEALADPPTSIPVIVDPVNRTADRGPWTEPLGGTVAPVSFAPDLDEIAYGRGAGLCSTVFLVTPSGPQLWDATITVDGQSWSLATASISPQSDCIDQGVATGPAWSSDGRIAFLASLDAIGRAGSDRLAGEWWVFVASSSADQTPEPVFGPITDPAALAWSFDADKLAVATSSSSERPGIVVLGATDWEPQRIATEPADDVAWSPDGTRLAAIISPVGSDPLLDSLGLYDASRR